MKDNKTIYYLKVNKAGLGQPSRSEGQKTGFTYVSACGEMWG